MKKQVIVFLFILLAGAGAIWWGYMKDKTGSPVTPPPPSTEEIGNANEVRDIIIVTTPQPGSTIQSPLTIVGAARGGWYFEGSFPLKLVDGNGKVLYEGPAQALSDWMTGDFAPFQTTITFSNSTTQTGTLILQNDNPSGLPENVKELRIPVKFSNTPGTAPQTSDIKIYFGNSKLAKDKNSCEELFPVTRTVVKTSQLGRVALEELLKGPTAEEKDKGYTSALPETGDVNVNRLVIESGIAKVDFNEELQKGVAGSCRVQAIRSEIEQTLKQFPTVGSVVISIDGKTEDILQP